MCVCIGLHCTYPVRFFLHPLWLQWCQLTALYISRRSYRKTACCYINLWHINGATVSFPECWGLLFWFCCMTLLGWVPEENLAESGSNVKSAAESRTEWEKPQKSAWCSLKKKKRYDGYSVSSHLMARLIMGSDLTFRSRFVNVCQHIILLVSQILNNQWHILLCDSLRMPFELGVVGDKHDT